MKMRIRVTFDREDDGRWIAEVDEPAVLVYGESRDEAYRRAKLAVLFALSSGDTVEDSIQFEAA
jgi:predicted RNase H-like HicB family nuclease